jgi:phosphoribosylglycinamide formyltransferase-1
LGTVKKSSKELLARVTKICLALPEASCEGKGRHAAYSAGKKIFAYYVDDHHGDGILAINCKVLPGENVMLVAADPVRFYMPAYIGPRGWVGLRLDVGEVDWEEVAELAAVSYRQVVPKRLAAQIKESVD